MSVHIEQMKPIVILRTSYQVCFFPTTIFYFQSKKKKNKGDNKIEKLTISELIHKAISALVSFMSVLSPVIVYVFKRTMVFT